MEPFQINPIDLMPFIGVPQTSEGQKKKLLQLYQADADKLLENGDMEAYTILMEKIKTLKAGDNS
jgi:hypothetical protein